VVIFSASCVCPDILSIIPCSQSKSVWISRFLSTEQPWPQYIHSTSKYGAAILAEKAQDVDDLRQNLIDAWVGVEKSVIDATALISGADVSMPALEPQEDILNYSLWQNLTKTLLINKLS